MRPITSYLTKARNVTAIAVQQCAPDKICPETVYPRIQWPSLTPLVLSWLHMVSYGLVWLPLAPFDPIWPSTAAFDHILPGLACLTLLDTIWPGFGPFDPVLPSTARYFCIRVVDRIKFHFPVSECYNKVYNKIDNVDQIIG